MGSIDSRVRDQRRSLEAFRLPYHVQVGFDVSADAYDRFMGRYSRPLAPSFADFAGVRASPQRVLDVGCGPGALTTELIRRVGEPRVVAADPSPAFVAAARIRHPGIELHQAAAEHLPLRDDCVDVALAQLVVHFMHDPVAGLVQMRRVTRAGGVVAACVWDFHEGGSPLTAFWTAARQLDPQVAGERGLPGTRRGHLGELLTEAGLVDVSDTSIAVEVAHRSFDEWWAPFELGVGPAGAYVSSLTSPDRQRLREICRDLLPEAPFVVTAVAWAACGVVP